MKTLSAFVNAPTPWVGLCLGLATGSLAQGVFTVQVGSPAPPAVALVQHTNLWHCHKGTNTPQAGWTVIDDASLNADWATDNGGFGYADNTTETSHCQTLLGDMPNRYTTFYARQSFAITNAIEPARRLLLTVDWDDGFVAWLDGSEVARMYAPGAAGTEPPFDALATTSHESSLGNNLPQPAVTYDLGDASNLLPPGPHVLALVGLNQAANSSDFVLVADLAIGASPTSVQSGPFFDLVTTNAVSLSGTNTLPGAARVLVNGSDAVLDAGAGTWSKEQPLVAGFQSLWIEVLDGSGTPLWVTNKNLVAELSSSFVGGELASNTVWTAAQGVIHVTNTVVIPPGGSLSIGPGCVLEMSPGTDFIATNATLTIAGEEGNAVHFLPADGSSVWGGLIVSGPAGILLARHMETVAGHVEIFDGATGTLEDSYLHDYLVSSPAIVHALGVPNHATLNIRRCHLAQYYEVLSQLSTNRIEDSLFEHQVAGGDGTDFDAGQPGSYVRRCTYRHGNLTNMDALDMGEYGGTGEGSHGVRIEDCLIYDFVDKGVSMGVGVEVTVSNCLIYAVDSAIAVKDNSLAGVFNCTLVGNSYGFHSYNKANPNAPDGGGFITNSFNNILWNNLTTLSLLNGSTLVADHSDFSATNWPGTGNLSADPLFLNPAEHDYRLAAGSPCLGSGRDGADLGVHFPVGAPMAPSHPAFTSVASGTDGLRLRFWADSEKTYSVLASDTAAGGTWKAVAHILPGSVPRGVEVIQPLAASQRFFQLTGSTSP